MTFLGLLLSGGADVIAIKVGVTYKNKMSERL